ncbi:UDP-N-acetylmuramoyl-L-alanyl-D-glutamate--2,6-diaminopimelate ligase [Parvibaculum sp.]|jgi:UDP-N-acetylmuramoyl-L-alanyl-D-glutamate--2,6-diaminopimelate ligase|uniref:UDP-N-acetylmuramoyl-L-alanyl-D-glutamate--2, 6-diaminopimelate ligase n=1 Tax=Parvibaculum sp. TaxID=2024848 RepID=UPI0025DD9194|nr:UDP-N-acetylmuramoyl-L-alanyl-D-glutamate--2,6-diaminopimelate ligase [Parvibaculum sp.]|tara:strand:+ start:63178 stop:64650 length:1473 start_codon:yes stop_codon:yes gene_type:complete
MLGDMQLAALIGKESPALPEGGATEILGLTADSRAVQPGYLFAALPGTKLDGTAFIAQALEKGASALLVPQSARVDAAVPVIADRNPRRRLALMAARFFGIQPRVIAAVTGTNGKTSVATFTRQIWAALGEPAASLGTLGVTSPKGERALGYTTPDPVALQAELAALAEEGVTHLAMEASSHGLAQYRLDGAKLAAAGFTNITRDHMDYHTSFDDYLYAKLRLFGEVMGPGGVAVINADSAQFAEFEAVSWARGHRVISVGRKGRDIFLSAVRPTLRGQVLGIVHDGENYNVNLPLVGGFQASNALVAAGLAIGCGADAAKVFAALENLEGARGRMEEVAHLPVGASVYVDYAHTPDALQNVLEAMRPHTSKRLLVVFGCGGDRDKGKRPIMGEVAAKLADGVYVTDDNPRSESAAEIRKEVMKGCPAAEEIGDRAAAIEAAMRTLGEGDVLVVAGKGHETGQVIGDKVIPFSDHEAIEAAARKLAGGGA